uniref:G_PROTEIN_RECEP_F1_2 domain-containing protein n=1 Tax=Steinernema glaseri TaxID=37863 RepID=A0A1I8AD68_9BILA
MDDCEKAIFFASYRPLHYVQWAQTLLAVLSLVVIGVVLRRFWVRMPVVHKNLKILLVNAFVFYTCHSVLIIVAQLMNQSVAGGYLLIKYHTYHTSCDILTRTLPCLSIRAPTFLCMTGFSMIQVSLAYERTIATYRRKNYEKTGCKSGIVVSVVTWVTIFLLNAYIFYNEDYAGNKVYCGATSAYNAQKILYVTYVLLAIDIAIIVFNYFLLRHNKRRLLSSRKNNNKYNLSDLYQTRENILTMNAILPMAFVHSLIYLIYLGTTAFSRLSFANTEPHIFTTILEACYILPVIYTCAVPLTFSQLLYKIQARRLQDSKLAMNKQPSEEAGRRYFNQLAQSWDSLARQKQRTAWQA